jgi:hypothetical protein
LSFSALSASGTASVYRYLEHLTLNLVDSFDFLILTDCASLRLAVRRNSLMSLISFGCTTRSHMEIHQKPLVICICAHSCTGELLSTCVRTKTVMMLGIHLQGICTADYIENLPSFPSPGTRRKKSNNLLSNKVPVNSCVDVHKKCLLLARQAPFSRHRVRARGVYHARTSVNTKYTTCAVWKHPSYQMNHKRTMAANPSMCRTRPQETWRKDQIFLTRPIKRKATLGGLQAQPDHFRGISDDVRPPRGRADESAGQTESSTTEALAVAPKLCRPVTLYPSWDKACDSAHIVPYPFRPPSERG